MDKLKMHSIDIVNDNVKRLGELFPECITEIVGDDNKLKKVVDFSILNQLFNYNTINCVAETEEGGATERYQFTWPDKSKARALANTPINATLRPCREESANFDTTENLYIEGDNLDVLKLLRETYYGKIKMIYIDPPYNTGNDFVYEDDFTQDSDEYKSNSGQYDEQGNRLVKNLESNGRFHTDWLNMMYPRLKLAKDLMAENSLIFISIGQSELNNTITMCDEIFGIQNRAGIVTRQMKTGNNQGKFFTQNTDYLIVYSKNMDLTTPLKDDMSQDLIDNVYNKVQESGPRKGERYRTMGLFQASLKHGGSTYPIECPDGEYVITPKGLPWRWNEATFKKGLENDEIIFIKSKNSPLINFNTKGKASWNIYTKIWLADRLKEGQLPSDLILKFENRHAAKELVSLGIPFDFPKPTTLIVYILHLITEKEYYVLDFFSGSATTAHAVMKLNAEDGGHRKFIMVQLPEKCDENSEAYKAGYKNICEIGKERIRRAGKMILEEKKSSSGDLFNDKNSDLDIGFRVLKLDSSNMAEVYYKPDELKQEDIMDVVSNIKFGRTPEDLLFQVMLDLGVLLSSKIDTINVNGNKVFNVNNGYLLACFDSKVEEETVTEIAKMSPIHFVMRNDAVASDSMMTNFDQIFKRFSPETSRKVL